MRGTKNITTARDVTDVTPTEMPGLLTTLSKQELPNKLDIKIHLLSKIRRAIKDLSHEAEHNNSPEIGETIHGIQLGAFHIASACLPKPLELIDALLDEQRPPSMRLIQSGIKTLQLIGGDDAEEILFRFHTTATGAQQSYLKNNEPVPAGLASFISIIADEPPVNGRPSPVAVDPAKHFISTYPQATVEFKVDFTGKKHVLVTPVQELEKADLEVMFSKVLEVLDQKNIDASGAHYFLKSPTGKFGQPVSIAGTKENLTLRFGQRRVEAPA